MTDKLTVAAGQFTATQDLKENLASCLRLIDSAAIQGADLVVLPEFANHISVYRDLDHCRSVAVALDGAPKHHDCIRRVPRTGRSRSDSRRRDSTIARHKLGLAGPGCKAHSYMWRELRVLSWVCRQSTHLRLKPPLRERQRRRLVEQRCRHEARRS